jgi:hypothetical protein
MKGNRNRLVSAAAAIMLAMVPAAAIAHGPSGTHGKGGQNSSNAKKYGKFCQGESKQQVAGQKGTPFSNCVNDMAKLDNNSNLNPHRACANESKQHVEGQKGTPYHDCVVAAAKLRRSKSSNGSGSSSSGS